MCILILAEKTGFTRDGVSFVQLNVPCSFVANRIATFLPGYRVVLRVTISQLVSNFPLITQRKRSPFSIETSPPPIVFGIYPVDILVAVYTLVSFGFALIFAALLADFLQTTVIAGGYDFSSLQNAACRVQRPSYSCINADDSPRRQLIWSVRVV